MCSVHIGCSRYSRRCHLLGPLSFHLLVERGQGQGRSRRNSTFGVVHTSLLELSRCQSPLARIMERFVLLAADPEMMQQDRQLAGHRDNRSFLSAFSSTFSQLQSPPPQIGVLSKRPQDVLCPLHQHHAQIGVSLPGDMQLRFALSGVPVNDRFGCLFARLGVEFR